MSSWKPRESPAFLPADTPKCAWMHTRVLATSPGRSAPVPWLHHQGGWPEQSYAASRADLPPAHGKNCPAHCLQKKQTRDEMKRSSRSSAGQRLLSPLKQAAALPEMERGDPGNESQEGRMSPSALPAAGNCPHVQGRREKACWEAPAEAESGATWVLQVPPTTHTSIS